MRFKALVSDSRKRFRICSRLLLFIVLCSVCGLFSDAGAERQNLFERKQESSPKFSSGNSTPGSGGNLFGARKASRISNSGSASDIPQVGKAVGLEQRDLTSVYDISIPSELGQVIELHDAYIDGDVPQDAKFVVYVQDIHTNYDAQISLAKLIERLEVEFGFELILVEGGVGDVSLTYLRDYATKEKRYEVADNYLKEGKISGEEYLNIVSDLPMILYGIEDPDLYIKNLNVFKSIDPFRDNATQFVKQVKNKVHLLKMKIFDPELIAFEKQQKAFEEKRISVLDYYMSLKKAADKHSVSLIEYEHLNNLFKLSDIEKGLNKGKINQEQSVVINQLSSKLEDAEATELRAKTMALKEAKISQSEFYTYLENMMYNAGFELEPFDDLVNYISYVKLKDDLSPQKLFREVNRFEKAIKASLYRTEEQRKLGEAGEAIDFLMEFVNLELQPEKFDYFISHKENIDLSDVISFINPRLAKYGMDMVDNDNIVLTPERVNLLENFYVAARERDDVFKEHIFKYMDKLQKNKAILITGGFHSDPLLQLFRDRNVSYALIVPDFKDASDDSLYRKVLMENEPVFPEVY